MDQQQKPRATEQEALDDVVKKIEHYLFNWSDKIGKGSFSEVYMGVNELTNQQVAIKVIKNESVKSKTAQRLLQHEIGILKAISHPNVIHCLDVFSSINNCYIITEFCADGDLQKLLNKNKFFQQEQIRKIAYQVYKGLQYLSQNFIVHRDLKLANVFIKEGNFKIADFGFAIRAKQLFTDIPVGSPIYMSPQGLINNNYGPKTDVWSFGVLIYELLHGQAPLDKCRTQDQLKINVMKPPHLKASISPQLASLILQCLQPNVFKRISISQIKKTEWMRKVIQQFEHPKKIPNQVPEKLTQTFHSTQTSRSVIQSIFDRNFTEEQALAILHYCRLLNKISLRTQSKQFASWLLLIFQGYGKCKITRASLRLQNHSPKAHSQYQNLKQVISQYNQKYRTEYAQIRLNSSQLPTFDTVLSECTRLYKQYQVKLSELKNIVFCLYKQTQLLKQSFKSGKIGYFAKHSQARDFLNTLTK